MSVREIFWCAVCKAYTWFWKYPDGHLWYCERCGSIK